MLINAFWLNMKGLHKGSVFLVWSTMTISYYAWPFLCKNAVHIVLPLGPLSVVTWRVASAAGLAVASYACHAHWMAVSVHSFRLGHKGEWVLVCKASPSVDVSLDQQQYFCFQLESLQKENQANNNINIKI